MKSSVLILGHSRATLTVVRSLAAAGFRVLVGRQGTSAYSAYSRFVSEVWDHPPFRRQKDFIDSLVEFLSKRADVSYVFPVGEAELECITLHLAQVPDTSRIAMPAADVVMACLNKAQTYQMIARLSIPFPKGENVSDLPALVSAARCIGYPVIVKPRTASQPFYERKAIICRTETELVSSFAVWPQLDEVVIVQEFINGTRYNCEFAAIEGCLVKYFEHKVLRSERLDDIGNEVEGVTVGPTAILQQYSERLLLELQYSGVGCIQFLVDERQGKACFLEINPRLDGTCALPWHYGVDLPALAIDIARGGKANTSGHIASPYYPVGKRVHWCCGDLEGLMDALKGGDLTFAAALLWAWNIMKALLRANCHMTWWWKDPRPTVIVYQTLLATMLRRVKRAIVSRVLRVRRLLFW